MNWYWPRSTRCVAFFAPAIHLPRPACLCYLHFMTIFVNIGDRIRLRERFFGATRTVLARL